MHGCMHVNAYSTNDYSPMHTMYTRNNAKVRIMKIENQTPIYAREKRVYTRIRVSLFFLYTLYA